ncbi:hypothetical protein LPJ53_004016 [Coemansia erecta]|uniref:Uncharacterized protein n=1 Tax=Coemansia erecta TaxID=147472 RepID=A0A9W7XV57_9FUNG|nr:hypothetical protein LPJ53_004016 [Coemansia erecta]
MFAARNLLANALAAEVGVPVSEQPTATTLWTTQRIRLNTRRTQPWQLSIPLRQIPSIAIPTADHGRTLAHGLKQRTLDYTSSIDHCATTGQLLVSLSTRALSDLSHAISAGLSQSYPVSGTLTPPLRIFKWTDASGPTRNKLIADTLAQAFGELSTITPGGRTPVCLEIARNRRDASANAHSISAEEVVLRSLPRMFTALAAAGRMLHDGRQGSLQTHVLLDAGVVVPVADEQGHVSQVAKDACALFELMCADDIVQGEVWCHFVPDSPRMGTAHWRSVVCVAQLAYEGSMRAVVPVVNKLCFARQCSGPQGVSDTALGFAHSCLILGMRPLTLYPTTARANDHYILKVYRRLCRIQPSSDAVFKGSLPATATQVAVLVSALPETLYRAVMQQRTTLLVDYFTRLAHAAAKCMAEPGSGNCAVLADARVVLRVGIRTIERGLGAKAA